VQNSAASAGTISLASVSKTSVQPKFDFQLTSCQIGTFAASSKSPSYERVRFFTQNAKPFSVSAFPIKVYKVPVLGFSITNHQHRETTKTLVHGSHHNEPVRRADARKQTTKHYMNQVVAYKQQLKIPLMMGW